MKETMRICQSCGMPMETDEYLGSEADGTPNTDYCIFCYKDGQFVQQCTMEEMIDLCAPFSEQIKHEDGTPYTPEEGAALMRELFPQLKRWKK